MSTSLCALSASARVLAAVAILATGAAAQNVWTDDPLIPGRTPVKAVHFAELRASVNDLLTGCGGTAFRFTDAALTVGVTPVRALHVTELRTALDAAYAACGRARRAWSDPALRAGATVVRAVHITELRAAVTALRDPDAASFTLSGTVRDSRANGAAVAGATVRLDTGQSTSAAADGRYRFTNLSGEVTVSAAGAHHVAASAEVTMDRNRTVDFVLDHTGEPPFSGTVFFPDILRPSDPTNLEDVTYTGRGDRLIYDRRVEEWTTVDAFLFAVRIHGQELEFQVNPEFGSVDAARAEVDTYAPALGRLPAFMLSRARKVQVNAGDEPFGGNWRDRSFLIHTDRGRSYIDRGIIEEVFFHEAAHVSLDGDHGAAPGWLAAQQADGGVFISAYARDFPAREDVAESILPYFAVRERPERLSPADRSAVLNAIPNRLAYFDRQGFVELQDSVITITPVTQGVSVTDRSQILVELAPEDIVAANLLDLAGRTLIFTPDGEGGYARSVLGLAWDDELGGTVRDGDQIELGFGFAFSGREWGSFFVSERGAVTFGAPHPFSGTEPRRFGTMQQIADAFVGPPTISALYKKYAGGSVNVSSRADRAVITWMMEDVAFSVYGRRPKEPFGVQAVLHADGRVAFSYGHDPEDPDSPVHWMKGLHAPAPFPWRGRENGSVMGGNYWRENPDGIFTPTSGWTSRGGGFSWLDLYLMGLAAPEEVPDMFVLRNLRETGAGWGGAHAAEKEVVTMEQVLAAMGPRIPSPEWARETFNTGFVYFLLPAQEPVAGLLQEHARYRDRTIAHWHHVTGGRGRLTSEVRARRSP